jgi:capsular exopolysaccharide synthesis family protein
MDGIQPYTAPARVPAASSLPPNPALVKVPSDYVRAIRRRVWLVLMVAVPLSVAAAVWTVRQPYVYRATAQIFIEPPQYDPVLSTLVTRDVGRRDPEVTERYLPNRVAQLKSKELAEQVVNDPAFLQGSASPAGDAAEELLNNLSYKIHVNSNWVTVTLEGIDPARTSRQLFTLLERFYKDAKREWETSTEDSRTHAGESLATLQRELSDNEARIYEMLQKSNTIGPGGKNIIQSQYETLGTVLMQKRMRLEDFQQQAWVSQLFPNRLAAQGPEESTRSDEIRRLQEHRRRLIAQLRDYKRLIRNFDHDPAVIHTATKLEYLDRNISELRSIPKEAATDPSETILASMREEIRALEGAAQELLGQLKESMPDHQRFLALQDEREQKLKRITDMQTKLSEFDMLSRSQKAPVRIPLSVQEPTVPIRPRRALNIALGIFLSFGVGVGLVCLLEYLDHSVKVPEHLTVGLTLPLLGVVPRIRRTALTQRGGHLWTPGAPDSVEADAYRNLRASLLGASDRLGPIVTLLVTSAKAGEGKSTTALNVAATCARAGERTLLMDVDLRRPSLAEVFEDDLPGTGLVDVLRGELPWQRTVVRTDIPNLDFLPTGDSRNVPIEILGTLELRQLLVGLTNHYDRVILDGPAVLGLADCRMLGRLVDAAILVVRSGTHEMRPLQRAKSMLEQSRVLIAGVVFNGLYEDLENWSSYGPDEPYGYESEAARSRRFSRLAAPRDDRAALPVGGPAEFS